MASSSANPPRPNAATSPIPKRKNPQPQRTSTMKLIATQIRVHLDYSDDPEYRRAQPDRIIGDYIPTIQSVQSIPAHDQIPQQHLIRFHDSTAVIVHDPPNLTHIADLDQQDFPNPDHPAGLIIGDQDNAPGIRHQLHLIISPNPLPSQPDRQTIPAHNWTTIPPAVRKPPRPSKSETGTPSQPK